MKPSTIAMALSATIVGGVFAIAERADDKLEPKINVDLTPPERTGTLGGYAGVVDRIAPSVVSIFTSREATASGAGMQGAERFFDSPMFRDFFGRGNGGARPQIPQQMPPQKGLGSGVILTADGYILTNNHVVEHADEIRIRMTDGEEHDAEIVATDPASDVAVIKVDGSDLPAATIGSSEGLMPGDVVLAIGSPFGLNHTVTSGIVSAVGRNNLNITGYENFIQTDASINPGNSGGALVDNKARVVGINTAIFSRSGGNVGIGFAIPIDMAVRIANQLISDGEITRGYLGISLAPLTDDLAEALDVEEGRGVVDNDVMAGTPAEQAGFEPGDVITACNDEKIRNGGELRLQVAASSPGTEMSFDVRRGDKQLVLKATVSALPENLLSSNDSPDRPARVMEQGALKGVTLGKLDDSIRERLELDEDVEGVVVLGVDPESQAAAAGLRPGNVITEVNRTPVNSPGQAYAKAGERGDKATLFRVTDGRMHRYMAIG